MCVFPGSAIRLFPQYRRQWLYHLYRARLIAEKAGLDAIGVAAETPGLHRKVIYYFREPFALAKELLFR